MEQIDYSVPLPTELWLKIFGKILARQDMASLRTVSKRLCAIGTPFAFRKIKLEDTREGIKVLRTIPSAPDICQLVRTLVLAIGYRGDSDSRWERGGM